MQNKYLSDIINVDPENDIEHHGVLGMKWGIRRYQPYSLIPRKSGKSGKETGTAKKKSSSSSKPASSKSRKQKSAEAKAAVEKKAKTARQRQQELEKIVNSGDAKLVYEHRHELTKKQLDTAIDRINTEAKVASLVRSQNPTKLDKLKQFAGKVNDANDVVRTGVNTYKTVNEIQKLYKDAQKAKTAGEKADVSARALKTIVESGNSIESIESLSSKLTKEDLATATQRATNLATLDKAQKEEYARYRKDVKDRDSFASYIDKRNNNYLQKSLRDIEEGKKRVDDWTSDFNPTSNNEAYDAYVDAQVQKKKKKRNSN